MKIQSLGYDAEADELDLLIDSEAPQPAETMPVDAGICFRREINSGRIVGAVIRGYGDFLRAVLDGRIFPATEAEGAGLEKEFVAVIAWQREALRLSHDLITHLGIAAKQDQKTLVETLLTQAN